MLKVVGALAVLAVASAVPSELDAQKMFNDFIAQYGRNYASQTEYSARFNIFRENLAIAEQLTAASNGSSVHSVTKFMDLSAAEFKQQFTGYRRGARAALPNGSANKDKVSLPASIDWRTKNVVTPVKNQGQCGSCWAFSTVEEIETDWIMAGNPMVELSPQQIVSCDTTDQGCNGGDTVTAYAYVQSAGGLETEADYPYTSGVFAAEDGSSTTTTTGTGSGNSGTCTFNAADIVVDISGFQYGTTNNDETTFQASVVSYGPMSVCLATGGWQTYVSGVLTASTCGTSVDHCVQTVGYNTGGASGDYWLVRNSWGTDWGYSGYIWVQLGTNACDIAGEVTYVTTKKPAA